MSFEKQAELRKEYQLRPNIQKSLNGSSLKNFNMLSAGYNSNHRNSENILVNNPNLINYGSFLEQSKNDDKGLEGINRT